MYMLTWTCFSVVIILSSSLELTEFVLRRMGPTISYNYILLLPTIILHIHIELRDRTIESTSRITNKERKRLEDYE